MKIVIPEKKLTDCRNCGLKVTKRTTKHKHTVMVDVYHDLGKYVLLLKNGSVIEHRC